MLNTTRYTGQKPALVPVLLLPAPSTLYSVSNRGPTTSSTVILSISHLPITSVTACYVLLPTSTGLSPSPTTRLDSTLAPRGLPVSSLSSSLYNSN